MATLASKRKRDSHDVPDMRAAPGLHTAGHEFDQQYFNTEEIENPEHVDFNTMIGQHQIDNEQAIEEQHDTGRMQRPPQAQQQQQQHQPVQPVQNAGQSASDTAAAAMAQYHTMTVPQTTEQSFMQQTAESSGERQGSTSADPAHAQQRTSSFGDFDGNTAKDGQNPESGDGDGSPKSASGDPNGSKPAVGSDEWHRVRRDNHKEVERRRRETINEGINELAKIVPGCEKNKGSILARAVQFITQLKENETQNIEKWTLEKLLTEQAIAELSSSCDKLKAECQRAWAECEQWKKSAGGGGEGDVRKTDADGEVGE